MGPTHCLIKWLQAGVSQWIKWLEQDVNLHPSRMFEHPLCCYCTLYRRTASAKVAYLSNSCYCMSYYGLTSSGTGIIPTSCVCMCTMLLLLFVRNCHNIYTKFLQWSAASKSEIFRHTYTQYNDLIIFCRSLWNKRRVKIIVRLVMCT